MSPTLRAARVRHGLGVVGQALGDIDFAPVQRRHLIVTRSEPTRPGLPPSFAALAHAPYDHRGNV